MGTLFDIPAALAPAPVKKAIEWEQGGQTHKTEVYIRPLSWQAVYNSMSEQEGAPFSDKAAQRLAESLCDQNGQPLYSANDLTGKSGKPLLCTALITALLNAISDVNSAGKT
ncbi:hypothetical protein AXE65_12345 [Ventosimonas gracilis]|uniref:Phage tail protein n=1 Tax=Ventosimonas gracilis TaxID=1680762 RepID=A0A139SVV1_9GAMM|nr:phage tail assembly chaperone family protein, TAC [Ventosimonas gracilis]KXU38709.1 hypothetical protein AXE65_12345 [Ventosimonas gracilis]